MLVLGCGNCHPCSSCAAMPSSGVNRVVRTSGYAAAASDPYVRHSGSSQGKRPRGRGSWRAGRNAEDSIDSAPSSAHGNPLARGKGAVREQKVGRHGSGSVGRRGERQQKSASNSGRRGARKAPPAASSGDLNEDLDAYFQGTLEDKDTATESKPAAGKGGVPASAAPNTAKAPAKAPASVEDLDDMLSAYMGAGEGNEASQPGAALKTGETAGSGSADPGVTAQDVSASASGSQGGD